VLVQRNDEPGAGLGGGSGEVGADLIQMQEGPSLSIVQQTTKNEWMEEEKRVWRCRERGGKNKSAGSGGWWW
jgi:hypothetical protein